MNGYMGPQRLVQSATDGEGCENEPGDKLPLGHLFPGRVARTIFDAPPAQGVHHVIIVLGTRPTPSLHTRLLTAHGRDGNGRWVVDDG